MNSTYTKSNWSKIIVSALTTVFGMQMLRALLPYLQYLLGDRLGLTSIQLGLAGLVIFASAFLTSWLNRKLGLRRLLLFTAGGVGIARLLVQLWTGDPLVDMALVTIGTFSFILFLPTYLSLVHWQADHPADSQSYALSLLLGLAIDSGLHGLFLTYDFIWQAGAIPLLLTIGLVVWQAVALNSVEKMAPPHPMPVEGSFRAMLPWLAVGPFLFLQLVMFQNQARLITLTGWMLPAVFGWMLACHLFGLFAAGLWYPGKIGAAVMGVILVIVLWPVEYANAAIYAVLILAGQIAAAVLISTIIRGVGQHVIGVYYTIGTPQQPKEGLKNTAIIHGASMVLMVVLIFAFYVGFSLPVPYQSSWLLLLAGLIIGLCGIGAAYAPVKQFTKQVLHPALVLGLTLMLFPLFIFFTWRTPTPDETGKTNAVRILTYNVHNGFNAKGQLDLEMLAQVIETQQPDIIALQEVSRGWVVNGSADMLEWFSRRLNMPYVFSPSSDTLWGQAVLSRYPVLLAETYSLPPRNIPLKRSFIYIKVDAGQAVPLQLVNAHLHHSVEDSDVRVMQIETILDIMDGRHADQFVMVGDLNAKPDSSEIQLLYRQGLADAVTEANLSPGYTFKSTDLFKRLDYVLYSPDLTASNVIIPHTTASDHLGISATIQINGR